MRDLASVNFEFAETALARSAGRTGADECYTGSLPALEDIMAEITGYHRNDDGSLARALLLLDNGMLCDRHGYPLTLVREELAELRGWGEDDGPALVWHNEGGQELLLPVSRDMLEQWLEAGDEAVYDPAGDEGIVQLSSIGAALCEAHGLTVDVDRYGCSYCVEHTIH